MLMMALPSMLILIAQNEHEIQHSKMTLHVNDGIALHVNNYCLEKHWKLLWLIVAGYRWHWFGVALAGWAIPENSMTDSHRDNPIN